MIRCLALLLLLSACVAQPAPSGAPGPTESLPDLASPSRAARPVPSASQTSSVGPSTTEPSPTSGAFPIADPAAGVPAAIETFAWGGAQAETLPDGSSVEHVFSGLLNHGPTLRFEVTRPAGYPWLVAVAGEIATTTAAAGGGVHLEIRHAVDGAIAAAIDVAGDGTGKLAVDPERRLAYLATTLATGGVAIHRLSFDGSTDDVLIRLDGRFTPDAIPTERYDLTLDADGVLVVEACAELDGCRVWEVPPDAVAAPAPRTLPGHPPIVCGIVGVTRDWLVVQDDAACWADTGDAPLPVRAIRRSDGVSHLVTDDHVGVGRVIETGGRTILVGADPILAGATVNVVEYEVGSGARSIALRGLLPSPSDQSILVSPTALPGSWVLLEPWFVEATALPAIPARLLDLASGQVIELPIGTFGWT